MLLSPFACFDCTCIDSKGERAVNLPLNNLVSEAEGKPTSSVWAYFFFKHGAMEAACLDLAAVICGCCGRTSASYEKAGEDLSLVCGLAWDEPPAAGRVESICDEWAGQRMGTLVVGYKRSVSTMKMDSSDLWPHRNWPETFLTNPAWFQDVALFANLEQEIMTQVFFKRFFSFQLTLYFRLSPGDEDLPHVPLGEHQRRGQAKGGWEARGEADWQGRSSLQHPNGGQIPEAQLREEDREDEREGKTAGAHNL